MTGEDAAKPTPADGVGRFRIFDRRLATLLADLRHGEMICVSDAGLGTHPKSLVPLDPSVEHIDLGIASGIPTVEQVVDALTQTADFESAIVGNFTVEYNQPFHAFLQARFGDAAVHEVQHFPEFYQFRDRARAHIQTGDTGSAALVILVAGHPSANLPLEWLRSDEWFRSMVEEGGTFELDENGSYRRARDGHTADPKGGG